MLNVTLELLSVLAKELVCYRGVRGPLLWIESIRSEVAFINTDNNSPLEEEVAKQSTHPKSLLIIHRVIILNRQGKGVKKINRATLA